MKLLLAYYGDPVLRKKAAPVLEINSSIKQLVGDMIDTMHEYNGVGLAAPQVHQSLSLFITEAPIHLPDGDWGPATLRVFINPKILTYSEEEDMMSEGCLSIPTILHENDHINGILFIDRIRGKQRKAMEPQLQQIKKKFYHSGSK